MNCSYTIITEVVQLDMFSSSKIKSTWMMSGFRANKEDWKSDVTVINGCGKIIAFCMPVEY